MAIFLRLISWAAIISADLLCSTFSQELRPWHTSIFSLSHVAVPLRPDDPAYGYAVYVDGKRRVNLGSLQMRGEKGVLMISAAGQLRHRANPFHAYM